MWRRNVRILEFNGVTGEPAHVYQPGYPLLCGIRDLCKQWKFAFAAGAHNRKQGHMPTGLLGMWKLIRSHRNKDWFEVDEID